MTDIVERLRWLGYPYTIEAADEIERLREQNKQLNEALEHTVAAIISELPAGAGQEFLASLAKRGAA